MVRPMSSGTDVTPQGGVVERWSEAQAVVSGLARTVPAFAPRTTDGVDPGEPT